MQPAQVKLVDLLNNSCILHPFTLLDILKSTCPLGTQCVGMEKKVKHKMVELDPKLIALLMGELLFLKIVYTKT